MHCTRTRTCRRTDKVLYISSSFPFTGILKFARDVIIFNAEFFCARTLVCVCVCVFTYVVSERFFEEIAITVYTHTHTRPRARENIRIYSDATDLIETRGIKSKQCAPCVHGGKSGRVLCKQVVGCPVG